MKANIILMMLIFYSLSLAVTMLTDMQVPIIKMWMIRWTSKSLGQLKTWKFQFYNDRPLNWIVQCKSYSHTFVIQSKDYLNKSEIKTFDLLAERSLNELIWSVHIHMLFSIYLLLIFIISSFNLLSDVIKRIHLSLWESYFQQIYSFHQLQTLFRVFAYFMA